MLHVFFELPLDVRTFAQLPGLLVRAVAGGRGGGEGPAPGGPTPGGDALTPSVRG